MTSAEVMEQKADVTALKARAGVSARAASGPAGSIVAEQHEWGGYRLRRLRGAALELALVNTGGGVAAGDEVSLRFDAAPGASCMVSGPAAERIYRSEGEVAAQMRVQLRVEAGASLVWAPQETILFNKARLDRRITLDVAASGRAALIETSIFGRAAMGERFERGALRDSWRIRRGGALIFAEETRLAGDHIDRVLAEASVAGGDPVSALVVRAAPDAETRVAAMRRLLERAHVAAGVSARDGLLILRMVAAAAEPVRDVLAAAIPLMTDGPAPRAWAC